MVILEHVSHTVCKSVEIIPLTPHDFHVLDSHSSIVEEELLQQISIVRKGAILPFWLSPSVSAIFRIGSITPETDLPVILHNSSELHIAPVSPSSLSSPSIGPRPLSAVSMEKVDQLLEGVSHQLNLFRNEKPLELISRCLPREISENDKALSDILDNHPSLIFTLYSGNYTICDAVRLTSALDQKKVLFSIVIRIPEAGSNLEGLFLSAQNILKEKPGSSLCSHPWSIDYVKFQTIGLSPKKFQELSSVIVELKDIENDHFPAQKIRSHILSQVSIFPILLSQEGIVYSFHLDGDRFTAHLRPGQKDQSNRADSNETCFAIMTSTKIDFQELDKEPDAVEEGVLKNFGFSNANLFPFSYQADILDDSEKLLNFHFSQPNISTNILILGAAGSGRTSLLTRLGRQLADSWRCVFSLYIDCNTWKGKQAENIEKVLKGEMRKLETRKPSTLFLDNLDFFQLQNEEEQRQIGIEKIFHTIRSFLIQSEVPVIVTAMVFDRHRRRELFLCYLWRTSRRAEKSINYRG